MATEAQDHLNRPSSPTLYAVSYTLFPIRNMRYAILANRLLSSVFCLLSSVFMQNKPNSRKSQMNVSIYLQTDYENKWQRTLSENKPNSNPIKPNLRRARMNVNLTLTKDYRKKDDFAVRINKPNFVKGPK